MRIVNIRIPHVIFFADFIQVACILAQSVNMGARLHHSPTAKFAAIRTKCLDFARNKLNSCIIIIQTPIAFVNNNGQGWQDKSISLRSLFKSGNYTRISLLLNSNSRTQIDMMIEQQLHPDNMIIDGLKHDRCVLALEQICSLFLLI
ncbi:hypothetical protein D3C77_405090 [compost metagenome]